jgi:chromosome partitioning protein
MRTIALATQKGGTGKSTLAIGIAVTAMEAGESVFMLEADRQGTVSNWGARRLNPEPGIDRIAGGIALERALKLLAAERYTLAIIDTPGTDNVSATAAIGVADLCLIPARPSPADIEAAHPTLHAACRLGKSLAFVLNQTPARSFRLSEAAQALNRMGVLALPYIVQRMDHQDALGAGLGVSEFNPEGKAAEEIRALWTWIKAKLDSGADAYDQNSIAAAG